MPIQYSRHCNVESKSAVESGPINNNEIPRRDVCANFFMFTIHLLAEAEGSELQHK